MVMPRMASIGHRPCSLNSAGHWTLTSEQLLPLPGHDHCYCYSLLPERILCNLCFSCHKILSRIWNFQEDWESTFPSSEVGGELSFVNMRAPQT